MLLKARPFSRIPRRLQRNAGFLLLAIAAVVAASLPGRAQVASKNEYATTIKPLLQKYCLTCHSTKAKKGSLDLERFATIAEVRKDLKRWQQVIELLEAGEMPPKNKPQPTASERETLIRWTRGFLDAEALARAGDPGYVPMRRLSNAEYDYTIRDLTGVDLRPTREFPADGAGGEGFTNAAEALSDISPALFSKYLGAAKEISEHAVLLSDGFRFSMGKTRRDWVDQNMARIRQFYAPYTKDGRLPLEPYLSATVRHRADFASGKATLEAVANQEKLNPRYLRILWHTLAQDRQDRGATSSYPLDSLRSQWRQATEKDLPALVAEITRWQQLLWRFVLVGSYRDGNMVRQVANNPPVVEIQTLKTALRPGPGQNEVVLILESQPLPSGQQAGQVVWQRLRFEGTGKPTLLLRDYLKFKDDFEVALADVYADTAGYLGAVIQAANAPSLPVRTLASERGLDAAFLERWSEVLAVPPYKKNGDLQESLGRITAAIPLTLLDEASPENNQKPAINGWRKRGTDLPGVFTNSSNTPEQIPGRVGPHRVTVHPLPQEFVAAVWRSPIAGRVHVGGRVAHAHPACGNGVAWWLEHRRSSRAAVLADGVLGVGGSVKLPPKTMRVAPDDRFVLVVDARDGNHACDLTEIELTITDVDDAKRSWGLSADVADTVLAGNPHADKLGNRAVWSFVRGQSRTRGAGTQGGVVIPEGSILARWRAAAADESRQKEAATLAMQVQALLTGARPAGEKNPDRAVYDSMASFSSSMLIGLDLRKVAKRNRVPRILGLAAERFGYRPAGKPADDASVVSEMGSPMEIRLPAALFRDYQLVVDGRLPEPAGDRVAVRFQVRPSSAPALGRWDGKGSVVARPSGAASRRLIEGLDEFRQTFPQFICYPRITPEDEVVCLKMYHREDELLGRLFLDEPQRRQLDRMWEDQRFISQWPIEENKYLPQFIGFVTQDQPKELLAYYEGQRGAFRERSLQFEKELAGAIPRQMQAVDEFAARAYRRPLTEAERQELHHLYQALIKKGAGHEEAFRGVLARVFLSPVFLFRVEQAPRGAEAGPVNDWELATRLSYFLWSSAPDAELTRLASEGKLHETPILLEQTRRMLKDARIRALAIEFGTQWLHVRGFDELKEKNEKLFPTFDASLRQAIYEEAILFFQDLFQSDRPLEDVWSADYTFVNDVLARHYGIPGVTGSHWRRVEGVQKFGRGGILGLASVLAKESGASRTSPVLRGNWVVETLFGEKLPRPPADVPRLPEEEGGADGMSVRQMVEKHARTPACAVCHVRIDPFGFALEKYDPIGRYRDLDTGKRPVDARAKLKDGTEFEGIEGLRNYLVSKKRDVIERLFCRKLLGYALGRETTLSDQPLIEEMRVALNKNGGRLSAAVLTIVTSRQFRSIRGSEYAQDLER